MKSSTFKSASSVLSGLKHVVSEIGHMLSTFAAASAAANAVENHRQPDVADLRRLGLEGVTFRVSA